MDNIRYIFDLINTSNTERITATELLVFLNNIDPAINLADTEALIAQYDTNSNGTIEFEEFVSIIGLDITNEKLTEAFESITTNGQVDRAKFISYYDLLQIDPIFRHTNAQYIDIILRMIGNTNAEFITFWNYINTQINR
ncbi:Ca2+ BP [Mythimna separata entomopoxvirus 'L']|uniref:Ca2+ BP n=1 Tax=Mythimna separata entomopoxvirus 'L' TaxID=1293572 RepID=A0A916KQH6_9POXV|nr:Ca2+ BP [Mythimna separata entomopoxvirus 'L']CCU56450.1 Ca2+ BP [Mythimna separata entomopoxvirus 'L']